MSLRSFIFSISSKRLLIWRHVRHFFWSLRGRVFSRLKSERFKDYSVHWAFYSCPVVNHPSQAHLMAPKVANMKKAANLLDGLLLQPGEVFSFWNYIGKPDEKNGYLSGPTFERGKIIQSAGGGLCQISGLLYNLALEGGMTILERHPHSIDAYGDRRYLPLGRDATVAWVCKDLSFQNNTGKPVMFRVRAYDDHAQGDVYSSEAKPFDIVIDQEMVDEIFVRRNRNFRKARISRKYVESDTVTKHEVFNWDFYNIPKV